jgi:hypothetical protein
MIPKDLISSPILFEAWKSQATRATGAPDARLCASAEHIGLGCLAPLLRERRPSALQSTHTADPRALGYGVPQHATA